MTIRSKITNYNTACIVLGMFSLLFAVCLALGVIWVRQDSARVGFHLGEVEKEIAETDRNLNHLLDLYAQVHSIPNLIRSVEGDLQPAVDSQIVWLRAGRTYLKEATRNELEPFALSFELAFMDRAPRR